MNIRRNRITSAKIGTNHWIWENESYCAWKKEASSVLWIAGKPGSGKSVLAKTMQERLQEESRSTQVLFCWWYYSARDKLTSHGQMLSALLYQLLSQAPELFESVKSAYKSVLEQCADQTQLIWPLKKLKDAISATIRCGAATDKSSLIIIDGLDEGNFVGAEDDCSRASALQFLLGLTTESMPLKIIFLSRPSHDIDKVLRNKYHVISMHTVNRPDIDFLIKKGLESLEKSLDGYDSDDENPPSASRRTSSLSTSEAMTTDWFPMRYAKNVNTQRQQLLSDVETYLKTHAKGVVLWVTTIIHILKNKCKAELLCDIDLLRAELRHLPLELNDTYTWITADLLHKFKLDPRRLEKSRRVLMWVFMSSEYGLQLQDLLEIISFDFNDVGKANEPTILLKISGWPALKREIENLCGPFVEIIPALSPKDNPIESPPGAWDAIQFPHETVRAFFQTNDADDLRFSPAEAERLVREERQKYMKRTLPRLEPLLSMSGLKDEIIPELCEYIDSRPLLCFIILSLKFELQHTSFEFHSLDLPLASSSSEEDDFNSSEEDDFDAYYFLPRSSYRWFRELLGHNPDMDEDGLPRHKLSSQLKWPFFGATLLLRSCSLLHELKPLTQTNNPTNNETERQNWLRILFSSAFVNGQLNTVNVLSLLLTASEKSQLLTIASAMLSAAKHAGLTREARILQYCLSGDKEPPAGVLASYVHSLTSRHAQMSMPFYEDQRRELREIHSIQRLDRFITEPQRIGATIAQAFNHRIFEATFDVFKLFNDLLEDPNSVVQDMASRCEFSAYRRTPYLAFGREIQEPSMDELRRSYDFIDMGVYRRPFE